MPVWCRDRLYTNTNTSLVLDWQEYCKTQNTTMKCSQARQVPKNLRTPLQKSRHHFWNIRRLAWMHNILYKRLWNQMCGTGVSNRLSDFRTDCLTGKQTVSSWVRLSRSMPSKPVKRLRAICDPAQASRKKLHVVKQYWCKQYLPMFCLLNYTYNLNI